MKKSKKPRKPASRKAAGARARVAKQEKRVVPKGFAWISAYLTVVDVARALSFYERAFGFKRWMAVPGPDGSIAHAEMSYEDVTLMLGPPSHEAGSKAPAAFGGSPVTLYVYCRDVDALFEKAKAAGVRVIEAPQDMFWGDRITRLEDPEGHRWCFATHRKNVSPKELEKAMEKTTEAPEPSPVTGRVAGRDAVS
jgi:PhnB protein